jgi:GTPase SAR1 family protein
MTKADFLKKYAHCAEARVLKKIRKAKKSRATQLNLSVKKISDLSPLSGLLNLQMLYCNSTRVSDLSPLSELLNLQTLNCTDTLVTDLSPLAGLLNLQTLDCSCNVTDLSPLAGLLNLQTLSCSETEVADLSPLAGLLNLQTLACSRTHVADLSPLAGLINSQKIYCSETQVADLSPLAGLLNLQTLDCSETEVSDLSPLAGLLNLQRLSCSDTQVSDLSPLIPLMEKGIEVKWDEYDFNNGIFIKNCPLTSPPIHIAQQGNAAILRWFAENRRVGTKKVNEARLLLLGQGGSGKTTLKEKLRDRHAPMPEPDDSTRGINIELLPHICGDGSDFTVHVWDFGGQNIQKYAHQFFLSDSVVYAVLSNEREQNPNFQYWLNIIELLGKDSPVFIVQNEFAGHSEPLKDVAQIQERFPQTFRSVEQVNLQNAATDPRFEALKIKLFHEATRLPHTQKEYLTSFVNVRRQLQTLAETEHSIAYKDFKKLCRDEGISDELLMQDYAHTFTFLGIALHFHDDIHLKATVFLRPKWIIDALFQVLYHEKVERQAGRFSEQDADDIWAAPAYDDMHGTLLRLMERFHLCYRIEGTRDYIVPQRLPTRTEAFAPPEDNTQILYRYKFMPSGILTQLTCRLHHRIEQYVETPVSTASTKYVETPVSTVPAEGVETGVSTYSAAGVETGVSTYRQMVWSDAVQFSGKNAAGRVFVREVQTQHFLEINAFGPHKAEMLNAVVDILDDIHANTKFGNLRVEKLVPCPCDTCARLRSRREEAEFFNYDFLLKLLREGETESDRCRQSMRKFPIRDILRHAEVRVFKKQDIEELLAAGRTQQALQLLRVQLDDSSPALQQMGRLARLETAYHAGGMTETAYLREQSSIRQAVLHLLDGAT